MEFSIRPAVPGDIPAMHAISLRAHQLSYAGLIPQGRRSDFNRRYTLSPETRGRYASLMQDKLRDSRWTIWVAESGGEVVGYTLQRRESAHLIIKQGLFVDPSLHGRGIGRALFEISVAAAKPGDTIQLSVIVGNERAKRLYEKHGFTAVRREPDGFFGATLEVMELIVD
jgi:ribosomal protein S18 acetylase RimI-like enzyme